MIKYTIYNNIGQILRIIGVSEEIDPDTLLQLNELYLIGEADDRKQYVQAGQLVNIPDQPTSYHRFDYVTKTWQDTRTEQQKFQQAAQQVLAKRKELLDSTDWIVIKAMDTGTTIPQAWQTYRQELRDITNQTGYPYQVTWPTKPTN